jgi:hypothetical protein
MKRRASHVTGGLALLALSTCLCLAEPAVAQSTPAQSAQDNRSVPVGDINREELASFHQFLDSHPDIAEQLRRDPSLVDNREYVENHAVLETYLRDHPAIREELTQHPDTFMFDEERFDRSQDDRGRPDINREERANFNRFLDSHPEIAEQLRRDPSLVDKPDFVKNHPALQTYLQDHPAVRLELKEYPEAFLRDQEGFDRSQDDRGRPDINREELANFNRFLDSHPEIAEQLRRDPSLVDKPDFVKNHPALQTYLQDHPGVREELRQDPNAFMQEEARLEHRDDGFDRDRRNDDLDRDALHRQFGQFLGAHADIAQQLAQNPFQVKDHEYLQSHPELQEYLNQNPGVRQELMANPDIFVRSSQQFTNTNGQTVKTPTSTAKPKQNQ